jgi:hypothetical protein
MSPQSGPKLVACCYTKTYRFAAHLLRQRSQQHRRWTEDLTLIPKFTRIQCVVLLPDSKISSKSAVLHQVGRDVGDWFLDDSSIYQCSPARLNLWVLS